MKAYRIETERLVIRCYNPSDASMVKSALDESKEHLLPWMYWAKNEPQTLEQKIEKLRLFRGQFDLDQDYTYGIFDKSETKLIGSTGLHTRRGNLAFEIGYWIRQSEINHGYALETTKALTKVAFDISLKKRVEIHCNPLNIRSVNIPKKLGYIHEATLFNRIVEADDSIRDEMIWTMFADNYYQSHINDMSIKVYDAAGYLIL